MPRNKITVRINGAEYTLTGDEAEDYLFSIANYVDKKVKEVLYSNPKHSTTSAAVLTALTMASELFKLRGEVDMLKRASREPENRYQQLQSEYDKLHMAYIEASGENERLMEELGSRDNEMTSYRESYDELYANYMEKSSQFEDLLKENAYLREHNEGLEDRLNENQEHISTLKDELLENQIELVRVKKDFKDIQMKKRSI